MDHNKIARGFERESSEGRNRSRESSFNRYNTTAASANLGSATTPQQASLFYDMRQVERVHTKYTYGNGDHYDGEVLAERRDIIRDGYGVFYCSNKQKRTNYEYHGEWRQNFREGQGHCYYYNEDLYYGQWKQDKRHG